MVRLALQEQEAVIDNEILEYQAPTNSALTCNMYRKTFMYKKVLMKDWRQLAYFPSKVTKSAFQHL